MFCQSLSKYRYRESITTIACRLSLMWACQPYAFTVPWATSVTAMFLRFTMEPSSWQTHLNLHCLLSYSILFILTRIYIIAVLRGASDYLRVAREFHLLRVIIFLTAKLTVLLLMWDYMHKNASSLPFCILLDLAPFPSLTLLSSFATSVSDSSEHLSNADVFPLIWNLLHENLLYASGMSFSHPKCPIQFYCNKAYT